MNCWHCGAPLQLIGKLSFRATCEVCHASLHCCRNCAYYQPGRSNDCLVPGTDPITDREANNFCEEFKLLGKAPDKKPDPKSIEQRLFGETADGQNHEDPKKRFDRLFE